VKRTLAILVSSLALAACNMAAVAQGGGEGEAGPMTQRSWDLRDFDGVALAGSQDVIVRVGGGHSVRAEGPAEILERLDIRVEERTLKVGMKKGDWSFGWSGNRPRTQIFVTLPSIRAASVAGSGDMKVDRVIGNRFNASVAGSGDLDIAELKVGEARFSVAGSGDIKAIGTAERSSASVAGSGDIDLGRVEARTVSAAVVGSGDVRVRATDAADVSITGSGDVYVAGNARCTVSKRGSGEVHCTG
jgi:hypothetical protein